MKKALIFIFLIIAAVLLGGLISSVSDGVSGISWLAYNKGFSFDTGTVDLSVIKLGLSLSFNMNIAQLMLIITAMLVNSKVCKALSA